MNNNIKLADCHTHCEHSHDSFTPIESMIEKAIDMGVEYLAFTDHCDREYFYCNPKYRGIEQIDIDSHITNVLYLKEKYANKIDIALGIELGYSNDARQDYINDIALTDEWDIILNSIHVINGDDCYYKDFYDNRSQKQAYMEYLQSVLESVNSDIKFDVVTHIGYITRKAPFENPYLYYNDYKDLIDMILKGIIDKNVSLEVNTHSKNTGSAFLPHIEIIKRYIELGGDNFTFGSDAHTPDRICDKYSIVTDTLKNLGVKYLNIYKRRQINKIKI